MRAAYAVGLVAATCATACDSRPGPAVVGVAPSLVFPSGLLQSVASVTVREYVAGPAACDASTGAVTGAATPDATATLTKTGCTGGALWCGSMSITTSSAARVFAAEADGSAGTAVAIGCTQAVVDAPTASISIAMQRPASSPACGSGTVQPTEQCDPPGAAGDLVCDATCHTLEELVSAVDTASGAVGPGTATTGARTSPALVWPSAPYPAGRFVALWNDTTDAPSTHVGLRVLGADLDALPAGAAPALAGGSIWMTSTTTFPSQPDPNDQELPAAVFADDTQTYAVVFADDSAGNFDIDLRTLDTNFNAGQSSPVVVNGSGGEPGVQTAPAVALGTGDVLYVVWQSAAQVGPGQIVGRTYTLATGALGTESVLSTGSSSQGPTVAALPTGWVVAWESGADIAMVTVDANGAPAGAATVVSAGHTGTQDHPSAASIGGGDARFALAWADHGQNGADIVVQRFDPKGNPLPGDSTTPINDLVAGGDQTSPAIAGSSTGAFYAVGWLDAASGQIRGRLLDASAGFDFNNVTGTDSEFQVSLANGRTRATPVVAIGGSAPYVAFAWSDSTANPPGIYARRFPTPP